MATTVVNRKKVRGVAPPFDVYIGRGDMEPQEWGAAIRLAREREDAASLPTADWLIGIPNLADLLDEGLALMGRSCT